MALQDILGTPDKVEPFSDVTTMPRGSWAIDGSSAVYTALGTMKRTEAGTTSTWTAATKAACDAYKDSYTGAGSISITQENGIVNSWQLVLVETEVTNAFTPAEA
jgi:hypothetical protein